MPRLPSTTMTNPTSWPPSCRSTPTNCTCCCILTPHTHLSDSTGYPHLNHIIRFPQQDSQQDLLAWFHCPHCPCALGLTWVHPTEMHLVEENVSSATWLPRIADFEGYTHLLGDTAGCAADSPPLDCSTPMTDEDAGQIGILEDRTDATNVPENSPTTPLVHRKPPMDGTRKSGRKSKTTARMGQGEIPVEAPPYRPRKSKYDLP